MEPSYNCQLRKFVIKSADVKNEIEPRECTVMTRDEIIKEIKQAAERNGGIALGVARFKKETGITEWDWQKFWPRFGDAVREAGCVQSEYLTAYNESELLEKYAMLAQKLGKLPVRGDLRVKAQTEPGFPSYRAFYRLGAKPELIKRLATYCQTHGLFQDVVEMCGQYIPRVRHEGVEFRQHRFSVLSIS